MTWNVRDFCPEILPQETVYSWVARWLEAIPVPNIDEAATVLIGSSSKQWDASLPSFLRELCSFSGMTIESLINQHTLIPYYRHFCRPETFKNILIDISVGDTSSSYTKLSLVAGRVIDSPTLNYCPECAKKDIQEMGIAYWHIEHQLPGVSVCNHHRLHLHRVKKQRGVLVKPPQFECEITSHKANHVAHKLAIMSSALLSEPTGFIHGEPMAQLYVARLQEIGMATGRHHIKQRLLSRALRTYWQPISKEPLVKQIFSLGNGTAFPQTLFYHSDNSFHPLKHLLMIGFLFDSVGTCLNYSRPQLTTEKESDNQQTQSSLRKEKKALAALEGGSSLRAASRVSGLSVIKVKQLALANKYYVDRRESKLFACERLKIVQALAEGKSTQTIAKAMACSVGAVEQLLTQHPELKLKRAKLRYERKKVFARAHLIMAIKSLDNNRLTRNELKALVGGTYAWLYKHDKEWLYARLPPRRAYCYWPRKTFC